MLKALTAQHGISTVDMEKKFETYRTNTVLLTSLTYHRLKTNDYRIPLADYNST